MHIIECQDVIKSEKLECMADMAFDKLTWNENCKIIFKLFILKDADLHYLSRNK